MTIVSIGGGHSLEAAAAASFGRVLAVRPGMLALVNSSYRSNAKQAELVAKYKAYLSGGPWAAQAAPPGESKHNSGTALDINSNPWTADWQWMVDHGRAYGWVPTINGEPWHFEYFAALDGNQHDTNTPLIESETTMLYLMINDGAGRYGAKNTAHFATYDGRTFVEIGTDDANAIANTNLAGRAFSNVSYATWEGYHTAATTVIDARK